jgi:cysteinyl-tRNA synthetase
LSITEEKLSKEDDKDKKDMYLKLVEKVKQALIDAKQSPKDESALSVRDNLLSISADVITNWLDKTKGQTVTENSIFSELPRFYENSFLKDMAALNILPPSVLTRVSEYVPEIIEFIEKIIKNGYAYESNGSVYFNTVKYDKSDDHYYAKLVPEAFGDSKALAEGEGDLTAADACQEKQNITDFALWKVSKPGEPSWDSPWGKGRPGWHIECSAMAGCVFNEQIDIHSGGIDLKFPHHDNEIAQSEAAFGNNNWVNFFIHSGHLHIQGCKMSKSLKNFITIKEALKSYTATQLRILFLLHSWKDTLDYSDQSMEGVLSFEKSCKEFFYKVKDMSRLVLKFDSPDAFTRQHETESILMKNFQEKKAAIHRALCDSINTCQAMKEIINLITISNIYINENYNKTTYNHVLIKDIALYITKLLKTFGVIKDNSSIGFQSLTSESENVCLFLFIFSF